MKRSEVMFNMESLYIASIYMYMLELIVNNCNVNSKHAMTSAVCGAINGRNGRIPERKKPLRYEAPLKDSCVEGITRKNDSQLQF